jgi:arabinogalactan oligomer / maltooligosaccharide transport system permease protein
LSSTAVRSELPTREGAAARARSLPTRLITTFSGTVALVLKIILLSLANGLALWAAAVLVDHQKWRPVTVLIIATLLLDAVYLLNRAATLPLKFLLPGTLFLIAFHVVPVIYTINVAFSNYSTGHILSRSEAIANIRQNSFTEAANGASYSMTLMRNHEHKLVLALIDQDSGKTYIGTQSSLRPIAHDHVTVADGTITSAQGYTKVPERELGGIDQELSGYKVPVGNGQAIEPQGFDTAVVLQPTFRYDAKHNTFVRISNGAVYRDDGLGSYIARSGDIRWPAQLQPHRAQLADP